MKTSFNPSTGLPIRRVCGGSVGQSPTTTRRGFTLIEMIGVLAVLAVTAAMLLPALIRSTDSAVATQESTLMANFTTALQANIQRNHVIPNVTNWVSIVSTELGMTSNSVASTVRGQPRYLLVDATGFGSMTLPYVENSSGVTNILANPTHPRFIFLSSLGVPLPPTVVSNGLPTSADFNALWNCPAGTIPTNVPWSNPNWTGNPNDITIQRLDLSYLFAHIVLVNLDPTNATFSINGSAPVNIGPTNTINSYFLTATVLNLYLANTNLEASQIINHDCSWVFSGGGWRSTPAPAPAATITSTNSGSGGSASGGGTTSVGGCCDNDPGDCCHQFNWQRCCTNACNPWNNCNPSQVCCDFTNYMCLYQQYAATGCTNKTCRTQLQNCCNTLNNDCGNLCNTYWH